MCIPGSNDIKVHISKIHDRKNQDTPNTTEGKKVQCPICMKELSSKYTVRDHIFHVHEKKKNEFECSICFKILGAKVSLKQHMAQIHENNKPFVCSSCPIRFNS